MLDINVRTRTVTLPLVLKKVFKPIVQSDNEGIYLYVHGSWADGTNIFFSDIDDFVVVDDTDERTYKENLKLLKKSEMLMARHDPLQHHGHWSIIKSQLKNYDDSFLPHHVLKNAICVSGPSTLNFTIDNTDYLSKIKHYLLFTLTNIGLKNKKIKDGRLSLFELKALASSYALLPPLAYQVKGIEINKPDAIHKFKKEHGNKSSFRALKWASDIRNDFNVIRGSFKYQIFSKLPYLFKSYRKWYLFASRYSPNFNLNNFSSEIEYSIDAYDDFGYLCHEIIRDKMIISYNAEFYSTKISNFISTLKKDKILSIYQFGEIKDPGISDVDLVIIVKNGSLTQVYDRIKLTISSDEELRYLFIHDPILVESQDLEDFLQIHTLNNLKLLWGQPAEEILNDKTPDNKEELYRNWKLFLLIYVSNVLNNFHGYDERMLHHLLKNLAVSLDFETGGDDKFVKEVKEIRAKALGNEFNKRQLDKLLGDFYKKLCLIEESKIKNLPDESYLNNKFIVGRNAIFVRNAQLQIKIYGKKTVFYLPATLFNESKEILINSNSQNKVREIWKRLYNKYQSNDVPLMTVYPYHYKWLRNPEPNFKEKFKYFSYDILSKMPLGLLLKVL